MALFTWSVTILVTFFVSVSAHAQNPWDRFPSSDDSYPPVFDEGAADEFPPDGEFYPPNGPGERGAEARGGGARKPPSASLDFSRSQNLGAGTARFGQTPPGEIRFQLVPPDEEGLDKKAIRKKRMNAKLSPSHNSTSDFSDEGSPGELPPNPEF